MNNHDLKQLLLETHPILPGQEARAWSQLQARLDGGASQSRSSFGIWKATLGAAFALTVVGVAFTSFFSSPVLARASADSQSPGIFATAFYSQSARAQVVWLNGMEPAHDRPTFLDPTTVMAGPDDAPDSSSGVDANHL